MADDTARFPAEWEGDVARSRARTMCATATAGLESGEWTAADLRARIAAEERRLTPLQRTALWMAVVADAHLTALCEGAPR
ncbi:MAG: hypothetical protein RIB67_10990 [Miltoncostaeaceae bacterium]